MKIVVLVDGSKMSWNRGLWFKIAILQSTMYHGECVIRVASKPLPSQHGRDVYHFNSYQLRELRE